jgi:hypothetical protein
MESFILGSECWKFGSLDIWTLLWECADEIQILFTVWQKYYLTLSEEIRMPHCCLKKQTRHESIIVQRSLIFTLLTVVCRSTMRNHVAKTVTRTRYNIRLSVMFILRELDNVQYFSQVSDQAPTSGVFRVEIKWGPWTHYENKTSNLMNCVLFCICFNVIVHSAICNFFRSTKHHFFYFCVSCGPG